MWRFARFGGFILVLVSVLVAGERLGFAQTDDLRKELDAAFQKGADKEGKDAEAIPYFEKALALAPRVFGPDHLNTAGIMNTLASTYQKTGEDAKAEAVLRNLLIIWE